MQLTYNRCPIPQRLKNNSIISDGRFLKNYIDNQVFGKILSQEQSPSRLQSNSTRTSKLTVQFKVITFFEVGNTQENMLVLLEK